MKRVLIISYYWPPCGGIAVLRCLKISKYLREFGWEPVIFTADNAHYPSIDESNYKDIKEGTEVLKGRIWEPYHIYKFITGQKKDANVNNIFYTKEIKAGIMHKLSVWIRSNFFIPDARAMWIKPSVRHILNYLKDHPVDAIFSDGPPHSNTRIATIVKKSTGIPWLADFQDPWTQVDYYAMLRLTKWGDKKHRKFEQEVFQNADKITIVSPSWKKELEQIGAKNVSVIPWGYDPDDYQKLEDQGDPKFNLAHFGILGYDRNPEHFFKALQELSSEIDGFRDDVRVNLFGQVDYSVMETAQKESIDDLIVFHGNVDRSKALQEMKNSSVLLLLLNKQVNAMGRIPGKLFEYLAVRKTILCLGESKGDAADIVRSSQSGSAYEYEDLASIKEFLKTSYQKFKDNTLTPDNQIEEYSIRTLTGKIAGYLNEIVG